MFANEMHLRCNVVKTPEFRTLPSGDLVVELRCAWNKGVSKAAADAGAKNGASQYIDVKMYASSHSAKEMAMRFANGVVVGETTLLCVGSLNYREWVTEAGDKGHELELHCSPFNVGRCGRAVSNADAQAAAESVSKIAAEEAAAL